MHHTEHPPSNCSKSCETSFHQTRQAFCVGPDIYDSTFSRLLVSPQEQLGVLRGDHAEARAALGENASTHSYTCVVLHLVHAD